MGLTTDASPVIRVEGLEARYGESVIFRDVSFEVRRGEIFGILGGSGCGKSTLMKHLIGLRSPHAGKVFIEGEEFVVEDDKVFGRLTRKMGILYQSGRPFKLDERGGERGASHSGKHASSRRNRSHHGAFEPSAGASQRLP